MIGIATGLGLSGELLQVYGVPAIGEASSIAYYAPQPGLVIYVARDASGRVASHVRLLTGADGRVLRIAAVVTRPDLRRQGYAAALYARAELDGWDVEAASGRHRLSAAGEQFRAARRAGKAAPKQLRYLGLRQVG